MYAARPKRMITILRWRVSVSAIYRIIITILLILSLLFPWTQMVIRFKPSVLKKNTLEGSLQLQVYPTGTVLNTTDVIEYDIFGEAEKIFSQNIYFAWTIAVFGALVALLVALNIILLFPELESLPSPIKRLVDRFYPRKYKQLELLSALLCLIIAIVYAYISNFLVIGETNIGAAKANLLREANTLIGGRAISFSYSLGWGLGLVLFLIAAVGNLAWWIDRYIFRDKFDLSVFWRIRGHMVLIVLICTILPIAEGVVPMGVLGNSKRSYYVWSTLLIVAINASDVPPKISIMMPSALLMAMLVFAIWSAITFLMSAKSLLSRHLMKATPFISLTLPDDELARRHKILPLVSEWYRTISLKLSILAFLMIAMVYLFLVHGLGFAEGSIFIKIKEAGGIFSTSFSARLLMFVLVFQALLMFKPTR